jgi:hypothetical protein
MIALAFLVGCGCGFLYAGYVLRASQRELARIVAGALEASIVALDQAGRIEADAEEAQRQAHGVMLAVHRAAGTKLH